MPTAKKLNSGTWRVRVYVGKENGKDKYKSFTAQSKREAERKATNYLAINVHSELTFGDAAQRYIEAKRNVLSPNTIRAYKTIYKRLEPLYNVRMSHLDNERVQRLINKLAMSLTPKSIRNTYGFITAVAKMFEPTIVLSVSLPEPVHKEVLIPTKNEVALMIEEAQHPDLALAIQMAAYGSLRSGECCALKKDMLHGDYITIARTFVYNDSGDWIIKNSPKTQAGYRDIPLPAPLMDAIRASVKEDDRIIKYTPTSLYSAFKRLTERLSLPPYRFHSLRHYFASSLHAQGVPDKVIAAIGGWEDVATLQRVYQHATKDKMEEAREVINSLYQDSKA